jgi:hypothetical protein
MVFKPDVLKFKTSFYKSVAYAQSWEPGRLSFDPGSRIGCGNLQLDIATTLHNRLLTAPQKAAGSYNLQSGRPANRECVSKQVEGNVYTQKNLNWLKIKILRNIKHQRRFALIGGRFSPVWVADFSWNRRPASSGLVGRGHRN